MVMLEMFMKRLEGCLPSGPKCQTSNCVMVPPSPPSYVMAPMFSMSPSMMSVPPPPPPPHSQMSSYPMPPPPFHYPMAPPSSHGMMMGSQIPFLSALDPPIPPIPSVSSSAYSTPPERNQYELSPEVQRWDRQEPEYKHIDEAEAIVAPDVVVADTVDEKSTNSEKVEKVHENERLARMDLKYEEPEPIPFDNGTVTFHAWFVRKL